MYIPETGEIIRIHNSPGVVLDKFINAQGSAVLYIHTLRNVFRGYALEYINLDLATDDGIAPATRESLNKELKKHQQVRQAALDEFINAIEPAEDPLKVSQLTIDDLGSHPSG